MHTRGIVIVNYCNYIETPFHKCHSLTFQTDAIIAIFSMRMCLLVRKHMSRTCARVIFCCDSEISHAHTECKSVPLSTRSILQPSKHFTNTDCFRYRIQAFFVDVSMYSEYYFHFMHCRNCLLIVLICICFMLFIFNVYLSIVKVIAS